MTATEPIETTQPQGMSSLGTAAARNLATTTKSVPQMQGITSRWLLRMLPWVETAGGTYRVNRRLSYAVGDGRVTITNVGTSVQVIPAELGELPPLRGFTDDPTLSELAGRFEQQEFGAGEVIVEFGHLRDHVYLIAHGKVNKLGTGSYGDPTVLGTLADGDHFGHEALVDPEGIWEFSVRTITPCTVLALPRAEFDAVAQRSEPLRRQLDEVRAAPSRAQNAHGEAEVNIASGHEGEADLPATFVDYEVRPREYELSVAQTVLRVHTRVADLYNQPMNQVEHQLRLTVEALRERQEQQLINNPEFGLLHNADLKQRIHTRNGPPTPDDLDELLSRRRKTELMLAHPRTIAAFGRECNSRGLYSPSMEVKGHQVTSWRGVPILPCDKIPVTEHNTSAILAMRTGEDHHGVVGLRQTGLPDEYEPGLNVRFMNVDDKAIMSYLVSAYYSAAVLVPDALGILENVEIGR